MQHHNSYAVEKMMQYREAELNRKWRQSAHRMHVEPAGPSDAGQTQASPKRSWWKRWFGRRNLGTS
jgi:hypothetical protein